MAAETMKRGDMVKVYRPDSLKSDGWHYVWFFAKVMVVSDGYAMLRRKGYMPFVEPVSFLNEYANNPPGNAKEEAP